VTSLPLGFMLDVDDGERLRFSDADVVIKASADTTRGAFAIVEEIAPLDTPLHVHEREEEVFYVLEGHHVIEVGDEAFPLGPGGLAFGPRGVPHAQRRLVPRTGRLLTMFSPAGFEAFFRELAEAERAGTIGPGGYTEVSKRYGITWLERASDSA